MQYYVHEDEHEVILDLELDNMGEEKRLEIALKDPYLDGSCNQVYTKLNKKELGEFILALTYLYNQM